MFYIPIIIIAKYQSQTNELELDFRSKPTWWMMVHWLSVFYTHQNKIVTVSKSAQLVHPYYKGYAISNVVI